jgi:PKHD-type hydroxylase
VTKHLCSYAIKPAIFTPEECRRIIELGQALDLKPGAIEEREGGKKVEVSGRNCELEWVKRKKSPEWEWIFTRVDEAVKDLNDVTWQFEIGGLHAIQYTSYTFGHFYGAHFDNGSKATKHRKLSVSVQLSDPGDYWGGALRLWSMNESVTASKEQGDLILFPSYLMHVAKPVFRGTRKVLVSFIKGDRPFR